MHRRVMRETVAGTLLVASVAWVLGLQAPAGASLPPEGPAFKDIASDGPLTHILVGPDLGCQVTYQDHQAFSPPEPVPADCGTFLSVGGQPYGPAVSPEAAEAMGGLLPYTQVSQSDVSGTGTAADPYRVVTVVEAAGGRIRLTRFATPVRRTHA